MSRCAAMVGPPVRRTEGWRVAQARGVRNPCAVQAEARYGKALGCPRPAPAAHWQTNKASNQPGKARTSKRSPSMSNPQRCASRNAKSPRHQDARAAIGPERLSGSGSLDCDYTGTPPFRAATDSSGGGRSKLQPNHQRLLRQGIEIYPATHVRSAEVQGRGLRHAPGVAASVGPSGRAPRSRRAAPAPPA